MLCIIHTEMEKLRFKLIFDCLERMDVDGHESVGSLGVLCL